MAPTITVYGIPMKRGVDISTYQTVTNVSEVKRVCGWLALKASGGDGGIYTDGKFAYHRDIFNGVLPRSAYHFLGDGRGIEQARHFVNVTGGYSGFEMPPTVDVEVYGAGRTPSRQTVIDFRNEMGRLIGRRWKGPTGKDSWEMIYGNAALSSGSMAAEFIDDDFWVAVYNNPYYPNPWDGVTNGDVPDVNKLAARGNPGNQTPWPFNGRWSAWQFSGGDGGCPGIGNGRNNCDQDVIPEDVLNRLAGGTAPPQEGLMSAEVDELKAMIGDLAAKVATLTAQEAESDKLILNDTEHDIPGKVTEAGWASRGYPFGFAPLNAKGQPIIDATNEGAQFYLDDEGCARHILDQNDAAYLGRLKLNPHTQWFPPEALADFFDKHPIRPHVKASWAAKLPARYQSYVI